MCCHLVFPLYTPVVRGGTCEFLPAAAPVAVAVVGPPCLLTTAYLNPWVRVGAHPDRCALKNSGPLCEFFAMDFPLLSALAHVMILRLAAVACLLASLEKFWSALFGCSRRA